MQPAKGFAMTTITFDTLEFVNKLRKAGATEEYAKAEAEAVRDAISSTLNANFSSHDDAVQLVRRMDSIENKITTLDGKIDSKFHLLHWMLGIVIALLLGIFSKQFF